MIHLISIHKLLGPHLKQQKKTINIIFHRAPLIHQRNHLVCHDVTDISSLHPDTRSPIIRQKYCNQNPSHYQS